MDAKRNSKITGSVRAAQMNQDGHMGENEIRRIVETLSSEHGGGSQYGGDQMHAAAEYAISKCDYSACMKMFPKYQSRGLPDAKLLLEVATESYGVCETLLYQIDAQFGVGELLKKVQAQIIRLILRKIPDLIYYIIAQSGIPHDFSFVVGFAYKYVFNTNFDVVKRQHVALSLIGIDDTRERNELTESYFETNTEEYKALLDFIMAHLQNREQLYDLLWNDLIHINVRTFDSILAKILKLKDISILVELVENDKAWDFFHDDPEMESRMIKLIFSFSDDELMKTHQTIKYWLSRDSFRSEHPDEFRRLLNLCGAGVYQPSALYGGCDPNVVDKVAEFLWNAKPEDAQHLTPDTKRILAMGLLCTEVTDPKYEKGYYYTPDPKVQAIRMGLIDESVPEFMQVAWKASAGAMTLEDKMYFMEHDLVPKAERRKYKSFLRRLFNAEERNDD